MRGFYARWPILAHANRLYFSCPMCIYENREQLFFPVWTQVKHEIATLTHAFFYRMIARLLEEWSADQPSLSSGPSFVQRSRSSQNRAKNMTVLEKGMFFQNYSAWCANFRSWRLQPSQKVKHDSSKTTCDWPMTTSEPPNRRSTGIDCCLRGRRRPQATGHGRTLPTCRRIEDTQKPSGIDPVNTPNVARVA